MIRIVMLVVILVGMVRLTASYKQNSRAFIYYTTGKIMLPPVDTLKPYVDGTEIKDLDADVVEKKIVRQVPRTRSGGLKSFMRAMAIRESSGNLLAVNPFGMLGKYQFSPKTLSGMGIDVSPEEFLVNEELQDSAMVALIKQNYAVLRRTIIKHNNTWFNEVYITKSGILAGAHLVGVGGVLAFFYPEKYSYRTHDSNNTTVSQYINQFANYNITFE